VHTTILLAVLAYGVGDLEARPWHDLYPG